MLNFECLQCWWNSLLYSLCNVLPASKEINSVCHSSCSYVIMQTKEGSRGGKSDKRTTLRWWRDISTMVRRTGIPLHHLIPHRNSCSNWREALRQLGSRKKKKNTRGGMDCERGGGKEGRERRGGESVRKTWLRQGLANIRWGQAPWLLHWSIIFTHERSSWFISSHLTAMSTPVDMKPDWPL